jgi:cell division protein FtsB
MEIYRNEIEDMRRKVQMLENNRDSLEKFAREQFYFAAPGEDVFTVEE